MTGSKLDGALTLQVVLADGAASHLERMRSSISSFLRAWMARYLCEKAMCTMRRSPFGATT